MSQKVALLSESLLAALLWADERALASVQPHVDLEPSSPRIPFVAPRNLADKGLFSGMSKLMSLQMALGDELLIALHASKGSLTSMSSHVCLEIAGLGEFFQALFEWTDENLLLIFRPLNLLKLLYNQNSV